jgi:hypothetical protein
MRALCWHGKSDVRVDTVPDPEIQHPRDAVIKITACAICGSDLHLLDGYLPTMESGDILGHENMGEVIELGSEVTNLKSRPLAIAELLLAFVGERAFRSAALSTGLGEIFFGLRYCGLRALSPVFHRCRPSRWAVRHARGRVRRNQRGA